MNKFKLFSDFPPVSDKEWENQIIADLKGADYEKKLIWISSDGIKIKPFYRSTDIPSLHLFGHNPGIFPFSRGSKTSGNNWEIREDIESSDLPTANRKALSALASGADSVGFKTVFMNNDEEMSALLKDINIEKTPVCFYSSDSYSILADLFIRYIKSHNIDPSKVNGSFNFDPFGFYLLNGEYYNSLEDNMNELFCLLNIKGKEIPCYSIITVNGHHFSDAGATIVQELAFTLASANEYLYRMTEKGMPASEVIKKMSFTLSAGSSYFLEIAKFRAVKPLWAKIAEQYGVNKSDSAVKVHGVNALWNKTIYDPYVNLLRSTTELMAATIGGCDSFSVTPFDKTYNNYNDFSSRLSRNQQIILKAEAIFDKVADPAGGSYYIENITNSLAETAWNLFRKIESEGGFIKAMESGFIKNEIESACAKRDLDIAMRKTTLLGTNQYPNANETMIDKVEIKGIGKQEKYLKKYRGAEAFEEIRLATEKYINDGNKKPVVFLLNIGNPAMRKARASFASNFFGCAGFNIIDNNGFKNAEDGANAAISNNSDIVVICSSDEEYLEYAPAIAKFIKNKNDKIKIIVAGNPVEIIQTLKNSGVDDFIHIKTNIIEFLHAYLKEINVL